MTQDIKTIGMKPKTELDMNDLNIVLQCPFCPAKGDRIIHPVIGISKRWRCLNCHKLFKTPKIIGRDTSNIQNIKTVIGDMNPTLKETLDEIVPTTPFDEIKPDPALNELLLPNGGAPLIKDFPKGSEESLGALFSSPKEIENCLQQDKNYIAEQLQRENEPTPPKDSLAFIKNDLPSMIKLSDKIETTEIPKIETTEIPKKIVIIRRKL